MIGVGMDGHICSRTFKGRFENIINTWLSVVDLLSMVLFFQLMGREYERIYVESIGEDLCSKAMAWTGSESP